MYCKSIVLQSLNSLSIVLIVAKCIVNDASAWLSCVIAPVLIVAKCIVNSAFHIFLNHTAVVLIVAKCIVNSYITSPETATVVCINSSKVYCKLNSKCIIFL